MNTIAIEGYLKSEEDQIEINFDLISSSLKLIGLSREYLNKKNENNLNKNGIYILESDNVCYVGQSKNLNERLKKHKDTNKIDFLRCFILSHANDIRGYLDFMEAYTIKSLIEQGYSLSNTVRPDPEEDKLSDHKKIAAKKWIEEFLLFLPVLGFRKESKILQVSNFVQKTPIVQQTQSEITCSLNVKRFKKIDCAGNGLFNLKNHSLTILKGSIGVLVEDSKVKNYFSISNKQKELLKNNIISTINQKNGSFIFLQDNTFDSCSSAGQILLGINCNGWNNWVDSNKKKINIYR